jgi:hypothetical protein
MEQRSREGAVRKKENRKIVSRDKTKSFELTDEAEMSLRRKPLPDRKLLRFLLSTDEKDMPTSSEVRMLAVEALAFRGYKIFDRVR